MIKYKKNACLFRMKMDNLVWSATAVPIRSTDNGIETLMTRRAFWNCEKGKNRPMRYPGEWIFSGGKFEEADGTLDYTCKREFCQELDYSGGFSDIMFLRSAVEYSLDVGYYVKFYAVKLCPCPQFALTDEVIAHKWMTPDDAKALICSTDFTNEQLREFKARGLYKEEYGKYAVINRQFPVQTVKTLDFLQEHMKELRSRY
jgi:hypothetical protein